MSLFLSAQLGLFLLGFLFAGVAEVIARKESKRLWNRLLYGVQVVLLATPFYVHGLKGNEGISVCSGIAFALIGLIQLMVAMRMKKTV